MSKKMTKEIRRGWFEYMIQVCEDNKVTETLGLKDVIQKLYEDEFRPETTK